MRLIVRFEKTGAALHMSHLDLQRAVQRLLRRSGLPVKYTAGFNPHTVLSFTAPLPVGTSSIYELMDFEVDETDAAGVVPAMNTVAPDGLRAYQARVVSACFPAPMAASDWADYEVGPAPEAIIAEVDGLLALSELVVDKRTKSGTKPVDIRPMIKNISIAGEGILCMRLAASQAQTLRPDLVVSALAVRAGVGAPHVFPRRTCLLAAQGDALVPLMDREDEGARP